MRMARRSASLGTAPGITPIREVSAMTTTTDPGEFAVLDQLIVRALEALRRARADCARKDTPKNADLRDHAEEHLDALLDFRHAASHRPARAAAPTVARGTDRLNASSSPA
jgi:hypothetical protein